MRGDRLDCDGEERFPRIEIQMAVKLVIVAAELLSVQMGDL